MDIEKDFIPLFRGIDLSTRRLPLLSANSGKSGPTVFLTAAIHGEEVTGTAVIQSIFKRFEVSPLLAGRVCAFPILNPSGFETLSRRELYAEADLNRCFGGEDEESTSGRLASLILSKILETKPKYVMDLHTDSMNSIAYTLIDLPYGLRSVNVLAESIALARKLNFRWAIETDKTVGFSLLKCLTGRLLMEGIPAVTIELGGPLVVNEYFRKIGLEAIWSFLCSLKMVQGEGEPLVRTLPKVVYSFEERIKTRSTGIIEYRVKPGENIKKGKVLGKIRNVFGETIEVIRSPVSGVLFSHEDQSVTFPGQSLFTLATKSYLNKLLSHSK